MLLISVTFDVLKLDTSSAVRPPQAVNMLLISVTFDVLKLDTSSADNLPQLPNILYMPVTFDVSKLDTSSANNLPQPLNIMLMLMTFDVSKLDKSINFKLDDQFMNIPYIFVTVEVSTVHLSIDVTASCIQNISAKLVITRSSGLSHLHLPLASGVIVYWVLP